MSKKYLVDTDHVANNLTTTDSGKVLDARQGKALKELADAKFPAANVYNGLDKTSSGYALDARQGKALREQIGAVNLLDNADWGYSLVNQRGERIYRVSNAYSIDRWIVDGMIVGVVDEDTSILGIELDGRDFDTSMLQKLEIVPRLLFGKTVTFAYENESTNAVETVRLTFPESVSGSPASGTCGDLTVEVGFISGTYVLGGCSSCNGVPYIKLTAPRGTAANISRVWLELGNTCHMAATPSLSYEANLRTCLRYLYLVPATSRFLRCANVTANALYFDLPLPSPMRVAPSITPLVNNKLHIQTLEGSVVSGFTLAAVSLSPFSAMRINATKESHGLTDAVLNIYNVLLSAEL